MKLERLDELKKITKKQSIVTQTVDNLVDRKYYSIFEIKSNLAISFLVLYGDTEIHKAMFSEEEPVDMVEFVGEQYHLIEEIENTPEYKEVLSEVVRLAELKAEYNRSFTYVVEGLIQGFVNSEELKGLLERPEMKALLERVEKKEEEVKPEE